jgi:hypothetical protein
MVDERDIVEPEPVCVIAEQRLELGRKSAARCRTDEPLDLLEHSHWQLPMLLGGTVPPPARETHMIWGKRRKH